jgi:hypothetical protein
MARVSVVSLVMAEQVPVNVVASDVLPQAYQLKVVTGVGSPVTVVAEVLAVRVEPTATVPEIVGEPVIEGAAGI